MRSTTTAGAPGTSTPCVARHCTQKCSVDGTPAGKSMKYGLASTWDPTRRLTAPTIWTAASNAAPGSSPARCARSSAGATKPSESSATSSWRATTSPFPAGPSNAGTRRLRAISRSTVPGSSVTALSSLHPVPSLRPRGAMEHRHRVAGDRFRRQVPALQRGIRLTSVRADRRHPGGRDRDVVSTLDPRHELRGATYRARSRQRSVGARRIRPEAAEIRSLAATDSSSPTSVVGH